MKLTIIKILLNKLEDAVERRFKKRPGLNDDICWSFRSTDSNRYALIQPRPLLASKAVGDSTDHCRTVAKCPRTRPYGKAQGLWVRRLPVRRRCCWRLGARAEQK